MYVIVLILLSKINQTAHLLILFYSRLKTLFSLKQIKLTGIVQMKKKNNLCNDYSNSTMIAKQLKETISGETPVFDYSHRTKFASNSAIHKAAGLTVPGRSMI